MPSTAWCWTISGSGKIMHGTLELPEGSFLFLGSGKNGRAPLYLDEMSIKGLFRLFLLILPLFGVVTCMSQTKQGSCITGGTVVLMKGVKSVVMHKCKLYGCPIVAMDGAVARLEECMLEGGHTSVGVFASGSGTSVNITSSHIRYFEECVCVERGAQVALGRTTLCGASLAGIEVRGRETATHGMHTLSPQIPEGLTPMQEHPADLSQPFPMPITQQTTTGVVKSDAKAAVSFVVAENCLFTEMQGSSTWDTSCVWAHAGGAAVLQESGIYGGVWGVCAQGAGTSAHVDRGEMRCPREGGVLVQGGARVSVQRCKIVMNELHASLPMLASATGSTVGSSHKKDPKEKGSRQSSSGSSFGCGVDFDTCMPTMIVRPSPKASGEAVGMGWKTAWDAVMHGSCGVIVAGDGFLELDGCEITGGECGALLEQAGAHAKVSRCVSYDSH
jgi:hypothetical protein